MNIIFVNVQSDAMCPNTGRRSPVRKAAYPISGVYVILRKYQ